MHPPFIIRSLVAAVLLGSALPQFSQAQASAAFRACSQGVLANCALIELTSDAGAGPGGMNLFRIAIANLGSQTTPTTATSIYNLVFATGLAVAEPGTEIVALCHQRHWAAPTTKLRVDRCKRQRQWPHTPQAQPPH